MKKFLTIFMALILTSFVFSNIGFAAKYNIKSTNVIIDIPSEFMVVTSSNIDSYNFTKEEKEDLIRRFNKDNIVLWAMDWQEPFELMVRASDSKMVWDYKFIKNSTQRELDQAKKIFEQVLKLEVSDVHIETINSGNNTTNFLVGNSLIPSNDPALNVCQKHYLTVINGRTIGINAGCYGKNSYDFPADKLRKIINTISYTELPNPNPSPKSKSFIKRDIKKTIETDSTQNNSNNHVENIKFLNNLGEAAGVSAAIFPEILIMVFLLKRSIYTSIKLFESAIIISIFIGFLKYNGLPTDVIAAATVIALLIVIGMYLFFVAARYFNKKKKE